MSHLSDQFLSGRKDNKCELEFEQTFLIHHFMVTIKGVSCQGLFLILTQVLRMYLPGLLRLLAGLARQRCLAYAKWAELATMAAY